MELEKQLHTKEISLGTLSAFLLAYSTLCGTLWHLGYWSTFRFNFLEYAQITDLFKSIIYPFFSSSWMMLAIFAVSFGITIGFTSVISKVSRKNKGSSEYTKFDYTSGSSALQVIDLLIMVSIGFGGILILTAGLRYIVASVLLLFVGLGFILVRYKLLSAYFKDDVVRTIFILGITLLPGVIFTMAKNSSHRTLISFKYKRINSIKTDDLKLDSLILHHPYLGSTSDFTFVLINPSNVLIVNNSKIQHLIIEDFTDEKKYQEWRNR